MTPPLCPPSIPVDRDVAASRWAFFMRRHEKARPTNDWQEQWVLDEIEKRKRAEGEI